jgi:hypothetical protein
LWRRRAFQLAHLSEQLALASEQLTDQARVIADAAVKLAAASEALVTLNGGPGEPSPFGAEGAADSETSDLDRAADPDDRGHEPPR